MKKALKITGFIIAGIIVAIASLAVYKDIKPIFIGIHNPVYQSNGRVLDGFDVVSYFQGEPQRGSETLSFNWDDGTWLFSSLENLEAFKASPEKFVPQFGGYCTVAVSTGFTAPGDPTVYAIKEDKLFIFSSEEVKSEFIENPAALIASCSKHWN